MQDWELRFPDVHAPKYREVRGTPEQMENAGMPIHTYRKVRARELFDKIVNQAHHNGEPGVLVPGCRQPLQPCAASVSAGSHQSVWRTMAWTLRELLPRFGQSGNEHCGPDGTVDWE